MAEKEYVERDKAIETVSGWYRKALNPENMSSYNEGERAAYRTALSEIENLPAADVRPVVRGRWEDETGFIFSDLSQQVRCSKCGLIAYFYDKMPMNFCPNCGAYMREES